jgi:hypothetical protein
LFGKGGANRSWSASFSRTARKIQATTQLSVREELLPDRWKNTSNNYRSAKSSSRADRKIPATTICPRRASPGQIEKYKQQLSVRAELLPPGQKGKYKQQLSVC